jgi:putative nucleotidyltransferase with HDIG domain
MKIPARYEAEQLLEEARQSNPGPWVEHSIHAARAAEAIAAPLGLDPEAAYVMGLLHDIGRYAGVTDMHHVIDGYHLLLQKGFEDAARICLTHSFPIPDVQATAGKWDCTGEELAFIQAALDGIEYDDYDRLIQLCDGVAMPTGCCLIEKRMVDVALRHGLNQHTLPRWRAYFQIQQDFESKIGVSVYSLLPGVVENTFGFDNEKAVDNSVNKAKLL